MSALDIFIAIIALPTILYIPGLVAFRAFNVHRIERLKLSTFESVFLQILASIVITGWIALILAEAGCFSMWLLLVILVVGSFIVFVIFRSRFSLPKFSKPRVNRQSISVLMLISLTIILFFHPSQEINVWHDIGVYVNTGASIAKTGSIVIHDPILSSMPDSARSTFYVIFDEPSRYYEGMQFPDFPIVDKETGTLEPLQPPLRQVWFAVFYSIFGLTGALYSQPLIGLLSILAIFLLCKTICNWRVGILAAALLTINFVQVYFSQYTSPDILFQLLTFSGIFAIILFKRTHNGFFGVVSGMYFGELLMTRIDAPLVLIPLFIIVLYILITSERTSYFLYFIIPFVLLCLHSLAHIYWFCQPYIASILFNIREAYNIDLSPQLVINLLFCVILVATVLLIAAAIYSKKNRVLCHISQKFGKGTRIPCFLMSLVILLVVYLWITSPSKDISSLISNTILIRRGGMDPAVALSFFTGWFGLGLALLGLFLILYKKPYGELHLLLGITILICIAYFYTLSNNPAFPWCMRRAVTVVLPVIMVLIAYSLDRIGWFLISRTSQGLGAKFTNKIIVVLLVLALVIPSISMCRTLIKPQFAGYIQQVSELANLFPADAVILDNARFSDVTFSAPLKYIYDKNSIFLWADLTDDETFAEMVRIWNQEGKEVYLMVWPQSRYNSFSNNMAKVAELEYETSVSIKVSKVEWEWYVFSNNRVEIENVIEIYRIKLL